MPEIKLPNPIKVRNAANAGVPNTEEEKDKIENTETDETKTDESGGDETNGKEDKKEEEKVPAVIVTPAAQNPAVDIIKPDLTKPAPEPPPKNVKVRLRQDHTCTIGGEKYALKKNMVYPVPLNVKVILERANLLKNL